MGLEKERTRGEWDERRDFGRRYGLDASDFCRSSHAVLSAAVDRKDDHDSPVGRLAPDGDIRLPVPLLAQIALDPRFGILEQVLVDRSLGVERCQLLDALGRQRVAFEADRHRHARRDEHHQVHRSALISLQGLQRSLGLVETALLEPANVLVKTFLNARPLIRASGRDAKTAQKNVTRLARVPLD